jgi:hypothetical protein
LADETAAIYFGKAKWLEEGQKRGSCGSTECRSSLLGDPGARFLCGKLGKAGKRKRSKKERKKERKKEDPNSRAQPPSSGECG